MSFLALVRAKKQMRVQLIMESSKLNEGQSEDSGDGWWERSCEEVGWFVDLVD